MENKVIKTKGEFHKFLHQTECLMQGIRYSLDDFTENGGNYTLYVPSQLRGLISIRELRRLFRNEVDADKINIQYFEVT